MAILFIFVTNLLSVYRSTLLMQKKNALSTKETILNEFEKNKL